VIYIWRDFVELIAYPFSQKVTHFASTQYVSKWSRSCSEIWCTLSW